jgi:2-octaprenyl-6-methoxyphenol hydroxylase
MAILGGGPIGLVAALLLARAGMASVVVDARTLDEAQRDRRLLALSRGTWELLAPLLEGSVPAHAAIRDVYVSSAGEFGATHLSAADFGGIELGVTVYYGDLLAALAARVAANARIELRRPIKVIDIEQQPHGVRVHLAGGAPLDASLAINAEGWKSDVSAAPSTADDVALVGDVRIAGPQAGAAYERFTRGGPLALLPNPRSASSTGTSIGLSLVWCMTAADATRREQLAAEALRAELQAQLGRIGQVQEIAPLRRFPLVTQQRASVRAHRLVAIGNAAQTLHPVAGQGFNLGVRDCATLVECLARAGGDVAAALAEHEQRRARDRSTIVGVTQWLPAVFSTRFAPIAWARSVSLTALDVVPPLRRELAHLLMFGVRT